ncbi:MAG: M14 metallopeptidase family protein [Planctomycetota bacterium]
MRLSKLSLAVTLLAPAIVSQLPSPTTAFGHEIGADGKLVAYTEMIRWWEDLARQSPRMRLESIGTTSWGQDQRVAVISAPAQLARIESILSEHRALALGQVTEPAAVARAVAELPAVIWIDGGLHASESIAGQNILELVWQLVSRDDAEVRRILDGVVVVVCPANPDGMELIAKGYRATKRVGLLPVLYQRYIGHDNNRDHYAGNQPETRNIQFALYHRWLPQVVYNHHQTAPAGTVIFTPPFRDPFNYRFDPLIVRGIDLIAAQMNYRFAAEGKPGVISKSGASYSTWWNGGLRTTAYFHNMIGILTEVFGSPDPTPLRPGANRTLPSVDYPDPIGERMWHARETIDYLQTANFAILDHAARYREELTRNQWWMARRAIERGSQDSWTATPELVAKNNARRARARERRGEVGEGEGESGERRTESESNALTDPAHRDPRVYVIPADSADYAAAVRLVRALRRCAVEVYRLTRTTTLPDGRVAVAGSFVLPAAQPFRAHLLDMLEPQWHPNDIGSSGEPIRPYDSAGWTLSMQMGVDVLRYQDGVELPTEPIADIELAFDPDPNRNLPESATGWLLDARDSSLWPTVNFLHEAAVPMKIVDGELRDGATGSTTGAVFVAANGTAAERLSIAMRRFGARPVAVPAGTVVSGPVLSVPRIGLFDPFGGDMATGWTEWTLREFGFAPQRVSGARVEAGDLLADYDVLIFCTGLPASGARDRRDDALERGRNVVTEEQVIALREALPPFEDWADLEDRRVRITAEKGRVALEQFVTQGGRLIAANSAVERAIDLLQLPVDAGVNTAEGREASRNQFFIPGSLLWIDIDAAQPLCAGVPARSIAMFRGSTALTPHSDAAVTTLARWSVEEPLLASGWALGGELIRGKPAIVTVAKGKGSVVLFGADVVYRGQPVATFKFLFNAIVRR